MRSPESEAALDRLVKKGAIALNDGKYVITLEGRKLVPKKNNAARAKKNEKKSKEELPSMMLPSYEHAGVEAEIFDGYALRAEVHKLSSEVAGIKSVVEELSREICAMKRELIEERTRQHSIAMPLGKQDNASPAGDKNRKGLDDLKAMLLEVSREIDREQRYGGTIPIPALRSAFEARAGISRAEFDDLLLRLESEYAIDLQTAHDMNAVKKDDGIWRQARGLLYYVIWR